MKIYVIDTILTQRKLQQELSMQMMLHYSYREIAQFKEDKVHELHVTRLGELMA